MTPIADSAGHDPCGASEFPSGSKCDEVLRDVWLFLDDEMDPERRATVQQHLDDCSPCLIEAGLDLKLKRLLHRTCGGDVAPEDLRVRLTARLARVATVFEDGSSVVVETRTTTESVSLAPPPAPRD